MNGGAEEAAFATLLRRPRQTPNASPILSYGAPSALAEADLGTFGSR